MSLFTIIMLPSIILPYIHPMYLATDQLPASSPCISSPSYEVETLHEQGSGAYNEDVLLQTGDLFGVFDGATSLDTFHDINGMSGGRCAAQLAAQTFLEMEGDLARIAEKANGRIRMAQERNNIPLHERYRLWSTSMAVIRLDDASFEYCHTGDSMILLLYRDGSHTLLTPEIDIDSETLQMWKDSVASPQKIHSRLAAQILKVRLQMNVSYGVLNGEPESLHFLRHGRHSLAGISDILLFTDGLLLPRENPREMGDWQTFSDLYRDGGLVGVRNHVRSIQREDADCRSYPRFKMHDDIAAISVTLPGDRTLLDRRNRQFS